MGSVMTKVRLVNTEEAGMARRGLLAPAEVRMDEIEGLVDTGAFSMLLPGDVCRRLGLPELGRKEVIVADGRVVEMGWVGPVTVEILGRSMICEAYAGPTGCIPLIGQIQLEALDLVVDPRTREARPNPAHPDGPIGYLLAASEASVSQGGSRR